MRSLPWWGNVVGEIFGAILFMACLWLFGYAFNDTIPGWGYVLACWIGMQSWSKVSYNRPQDMDK